LTTSLIGLAVSVVLIGVVLLEVNPGAAAATLGRAQPLVLLLVLPLLAVDQTARTIRWHLLLAHEPRPGYRETLRYLLVGYLVNIVLPGRLGEFVRAHLAGTRAHVGQLRALGSIALERGLDLVSAATLGAIASAAAGLGSAITGAFTLVAALGWIVLLTVTLVPHDFVRRLLDWVVTRFSRGPARLVLPHVGSFGHALIDAAAPRRVVAASGLTLISWTTGTAVFAIVAGSLGIPVSPIVLLAMVTAANLGAAIPSAPAGVGPFEFAVVYVGTAAGLDGSQALAVGILAHLVGVVPVAVAGAISLPAVDWRLGQLRNLSALRRSAATGDPYDGPYHTAAPAASTDSHESAPPLS